MTEAIRRLHGRSSSLLEDLREVVGKPNTGLKSILDELFPSDTRISSDRFGSSQLNGVTIFSSKSNSFGSSPLNGVTISSKSNCFGSSQLNGVTISSKSNCFGSSQLNGATWVQLPPVVREEDGTVRPIMGTDHPMALYHQLLFNNMS
jgi:hypothetical protein